MKRTCPRLVQGYVQTAQTKLRLTWKLVVRCPHILVLPAILCAAMIVLGVLGVCLAKAQHERDARSTAAVDAEGASKALQLAIQRASLPLAQLAETIKLLPQKQALERQFNITATSVWLGTAQGSMFFMVSPLGINSLVYPASSRYFNPRSLGVNLLTQAEIRAASFRMLQDKTIALQGPVLLPDPQQTFLCVIQLPIYISNVTANETWGHPPNPADCPQNMCYDAATATKWWGFASLNLNGRWLFGPDGPLSALPRKNYKYQLWRPPVIRSANPVQTLSAVTETGVQQNEPADAVVLSIPVIDQMWELHVWKDSWAPTWMLPLIVVVVLGALIVSALLFSTLSSWEEHRALLHSLLPKETIARMRHEAKWAAAEGDDDIKTVRLETPAELMLRIIEDCVAGRSPGLPLLLNVKEALQRSADVYRPSEQQMKERLDEVTDMDEDVRRALTTQLLGASVMFSRLVAGEPRTSGPGIFPVREASSAGSQLSQGPSCAQDDPPEACAKSQTEMQRIDTDQATIKSVRFASVTDSNSEPMQHLLRAAASGHKASTGAASKQLSSDRLASHASACSSVMKSRGFTEEVGTVLASWMLQVPSIFGLLQGAHALTTALRQDQPASQDAGTGVASLDGSHVDGAVASPFKTPWAALESSDVDAVRPELTVQLAVNAATEALPSPARPSPHLGLAAAVLPVTRQGTGCTDSSGLHLQLGQALLNKSTGQHDRLRQPGSSPVEARSGDDLSDTVEPVALILTPILTQLEQVLVSADDWSFDAYALEEASHGRPLSCLAFWLLHYTGLKDWARMSTKRLIRFLERVEEGYADNPYHNRRHAADVLQSVHVLMHKSGLVPGFADQLTMLGCYLAAIVHDFEHVGRTNDFLVNSSDHLAVRYNDRSPMENHHLAAAWSLLKTRDCSILSGLSGSEMAKLRKLVIDLVLATDMKQHFAIVGQFETMTRQVYELAEGQNNNTKTSGYRTMNAPSGELRSINDQDRLLSLQMMLKCADLGHLTAPLQVHLKWVAALEAEFFLQGDEEEKLGISISPLCDRTKEGVTKSQVGFFDFVVLPLFKTFTQRFSGASPMLQAAMSNLAHWRSNTELRSRKSEYTA